MFEHFDFAILDDPDFKEDAVREELIVPILNRLGYSATGEHRIHRSKPLVHPFVYIGTKQYKVNIIPDYLLAVDGSIRWVLDAKAPAEDILKGKNVEQAYSYSIHKDVRVSVYGLCNGHDLAVFHVSHVEPMLRVSLKEIDARWNEVNKALCPMAFIDPERLGFFPDFGLAMLRLGGANFETIWFPWVGLHYISKISDDLYALTTQFNLASDYYATFDLDPPMYQVLLSQLSEADRVRTKEALSHQPYQMSFDDPPNLELKAKLESNVISNEREDYVPFKVLEIKAGKFTAEDMLEIAPYES
jgi:hypothetical protein